MKNQNNEITIKINVSDDMLAAIANVLVLANSPMTRRAAIGTKPTATPLPPISPIGFRAKGRG